MDPVWETLPCVTLTFCSCLAPQNPAPQSKDGPANGGKPVTVRASTINQKQSFREKLVIYFWLFIVVATKLKVVTDTLKNWKDGAREMHKGM